MQGHIVFTDGKIQFQLSPCLSINFLKILFIFRDRGREGEKEGEKHQYVVISRTPYWKPGPQPRHVP